MNMTNDKCPLCGSDDIEGGAVSIEYNSAYQDCTCNACNAGWQDCYSYTGAVIQRLAEDVNGDQYDRDDDGPDQSDREPSHGPDYWRNDAGEPRLG